MTDLNLLESLYFGALERPAAERPAYLDDACGGNAELRARVERLLAALPNVRGFLGASPAGGPAATLKQPLGTIDAPPPDVVGTVVCGRYKLLEEVGEGGMGTVWMAEQREPVKRLVALKLIKAGMDSRAVLARFEAERQALALMDHPNIARIFDGGTTGGEPESLSAGRPYFVMELVKGLPLTTYCDGRRLSVRDRLDLFVQVCSAVQHAHQKGIVHRDLKPGNVLVTEHDGKPVPKVIDFGLAKALHGPQALTEKTLHTSFGAIVGTPLYMAPEQVGINALDVDTRTDIYALGVILYELLTGTPPLERKRLADVAWEEIRRLIREEDPPRPSMRLSASDALPNLAATRQSEPAKLSKLVRGELDWIVMKALEKDRNRRYETANGFAMDVQRYLHDEPVTAGPPSASYRLRKFVRRNRRPVLAGCLVLSALVAGMIGTTAGMFHANRAARAERLAKDDALEQKRLAEQAAEQERLAKAREAQRADGEQKAKLEAEARRQEAERNLAFAKKGNAILGSVFAGLDPKQIAESGRPLQDVLRDNLGKAVKELEGSAIGDPLEVAAMQNTLGLSLVGLGEYALAVEVFDRALQTRQSKLGPDHPHTLQSMNNLAWSYQEAGQLDKALPLYEETFRLSKAKFGPEDPKTLICMNSLALGYHAARQFDKAVQLLEDTLKVEKAKLGPDHPQTLTTMNNLARGYSVIGKLDKALPLWEETLKLRQTKLGPDHPQTLTSMNNLAIGYRYTQQFDKALAMLEEALRLQKAKLGPDHPKTLNTMNNLAGFYADAGKLGSALPLLEQTFKLTKAKLGPDHPQTFASMSSLGRGYQAAGQLDKALPLLEDTLKRQKAKLGPEHLDVPFTMDHLAGCYQDARQFDKALPLYEEALKLRKAKLGTGHLVTLTSMDHLARGYQAAGLLDKALPLLEETLKLRKAKLGPAHPDTLASLAQLGLGLLEQKKWSEAESLLRECLTIREKQEPDAWPTFDTKSMLGGALLAQKQYADAEALLLKGYEGMKQRDKTIPPVGTPRILEALDRLIELYTVTNRPDQAKQWQAEKAKYPPINPITKGKPDTR